MKINYQVKTNVLVEKSVDVEDPNFICVQHYVDGIERYTAFIGKGEGIIQKRTVTICPSGGLLEIRRMDASAELNAKELLKKDECNKIIPKSQFVMLYNYQLPMMMEYALPSPIKRTPPELPADRVG